MMRFIAALVLLTTPAFAATTHTFNVASNAPAWQPAALYTHTGHLGDRVLVGSGPKYLLELVAGGQSGSTEPAVASCPGPVSDGATAWKCLTVVDYVTLQSAMWDDPVKWAPNTAFQPQQVVINAGLSWMRDNLFASVSAPCTSGPGPGPVSTAVDPATGRVGEGACAWTLMAAVPYSTGHPWPHMVNGAHPVVQEPYDDHIFNVWHGGYGATPEAVSILFHQMWYPNDTQPFCPDGTNIWPDHCAAGLGGRATIQAAPGDGFCNNPPGTPLRYDPSKGVAFENPNGTAILLGDAFVTLNCLQIKNAGGGASDSAIAGFIWHNNNEIISNNIIDSASIAAIAVDANNYILNNLIVHRNQAPGSMAVMAKYWSTIHNNDIVQIGPAPANGVPVYQFCLQWPNPFESLFIDNNNLFGFSASVATGNAPNCTTPPYVGTSTNHNSTDLANGMAPVVYTDAWGGQSSTAYSLVNPANLFGQSAAATFVDPASDFQLKSGSPSRGAGASDTANPVDMFGVTR